MQNGLFAGIKERVSADVLLFELLPLVFRPIIVIGHFRNIAAVVHFVKAAVFKRQNLRHTELKLPRWPHFEPYPVKPAYGKSSLPENVLHFYLLASNILAYNHLIDSLVFKSQPRQKTRVNVGNARRCYAALYQLLDNIRVVVFVAKLHYAQS